MDRKKLAAFAVITTIAVCALIPLMGLPALSAFAFLGMALSVKDNSLKVTKALPNGANTTVSDGIDLMAGTRSEFQANCELLVSAPALTTTELGDTQTISYDVYHAASSDFSDEALIHDNIITQTGASGAGAAAATARFRPPSNVRRYVRVKAVKAGASNASTSSFTAQLVF